MLILCATPIGNLEDISLRLIGEIQRTDTIAAEDTRVTRQLLIKIERLLYDKYNITLDIKNKRLISLHDHNEADRISQITELLQNGEDVLIMSDAGTPMINDPGYKIVQAVIDLGLEITSLPGPTAPILALILSGLPVHKFTYEGFLPPKSGSRQNALRLLRDEQRTMIFLASKHKINQTIADMHEIFGGERKVAICRELTKAHEEIIRGTLEQVLGIIEKRELKGEMCVCLDGN